MKNTATFQKAEKLQNLIKELLAYNDVEPVYDFALRGTDNPNTLDNIMKTQERLQAEIDDLARELNTLMGRQIKFPMADSYAYYIVTKVMKTQVQLTWVKYCDAWQDDRTGYQSNIGRGYVEKKVKGEDRMAELFGAKRVQA